MNHRGAAGGPDDTGQHMDRRGLSCRRGTQQAGDPARLVRQVEMVDGGEVAEALA